MVNVRFDAYARESMNGKLSVMYYNTNIPVDPVYCSEVNVICDICATFFGVVAVA